jgi:hypothetical protein
MTPKRMACAAALLLALTAACGGGGAKADKGQAPAAATPQPTTTAVVSGTYPLTGMPAVVAANASRRAVAVKIDNNSAARPQAGIDKADVVYEEFTEGITRFVVVFQSSDAPMVGPVRSVRPADPNIVKPLGGPLVFSGGSPAVLDIVKAAGITLVTENDTDTLKRRSGKTAPHNLYTNTADMFRKAGAGVPPPSFGFFMKPGDKSAPAGGTPATSIRLAPAPSVTANYLWDAGAGVWRRTTDGKPHMLEGGAQIAPTNVIVQFTPYAAFPADQKVRFPQVIGSGDALVFVNGTQVKAKWNKAAAGSVTTYTDLSGKPIVLAAGQTWVHLQEPGSAVTVS